MSTLNEHTLPHDSHPNASQPGPNHPYATKSVSELIALAQSYCTVLKEQYRLKPHNLNPCAALTELEHQLQAMKIATESLQRLNEQLQQEQEPGQEPEPEPEPMPMTAEQIAQRLRTASLKIAPKRIQACIEDHRHGIQRPIQASYSPQQAPELKAPAQAVNLFQKTSASARYREKIAQSLTQGMTQVRTQFIKTKNHLERGLSPLNAHPFSKQINSK